MYDDNAAAYDDVASGETQCQEEVVKGGGRGEVGGDEGGAGGGEITMTIA